MLCLIGVEKEMVGGVEVKVNKVWVFVCWLGDNRKLEIEVEGLRSSASSFSIRRKLDGNDEEYYKLTMIASKSSMLHIGEVDSWFLSPSSPPLI